jgi:uncharacterized protein (TIGR00297 family)
MLIALAVAIPIAALALVAGALTMSGAVAAIVLGALCVLAGWGWAALLILYFVVAVAFSKLGAEAKANRTGGVVAKAGRRDAVQVLANGGVFALAAFLSNHSGTSSGSLFAVAAVGALAASAADTLATEIGTFVGGEPRSVMTWQVVPTGTSGGVSIAGSLAMLGGAVLIALAASGMGLTAYPTAAAFGGIAGAIADSVLGALLQERRHCARCDLATERRVHDCGTATVRAGGIPWLDNDLVNLCATLAGAGGGAPRCGAQPYRVE